MCKLAICIIDHALRYETERCQRYLNKMGTDGKNVFFFKNVSQFRKIEEEYIAFWDVFDKWELQKIEVCMSHIAGKDADIIIHSYIQHVGLKSILYRVPDSGQADMMQIFYQGLPGISAMVFRREWLWNLLAEQEDIEIGSEKFYHLLFDMFISGRCNIECIARPLSEHWSYYGSKTPSAKRAKDNIFRYWNAIDVKTRDKLIPMCYEYFTVNYGEFPITEFIEEVAMNKHELTEVFRIHEENLTRQLQAANRKAERKNDFYIFMRNWVEFHQSGGSIADKLLQENISTVAIYGAGKHGIMLYNELKSTGVKAAYWIDKNRRTETVEGYPVIDLEGELPPVDAVIVTPYREFQTIENLLREKTKARIIPLDILVRR